MASSDRSGEEEYMRARNGPLGSTRRSGNEARRSCSSSEDVREPSDEVSQRDTGLDESLSAENALVLKAEGNHLFNSGDNEACLQKYAAALRSAHLPDSDRAVLYANSAAAYVRLGSWQDAKDAASKALDINPAYNKALLRRKIAAENLEDWSTAAKDAKALGAPAAEVSLLEVKAKRKAEKETEEALEQLKGLGNSFLSNFGLNLDNFQMDKDPETGSYSIKMKQ